MIPLGRLLPLAAITASAALVVTVASDEPAGPVVESQAEREDVSPPTSFAPPPSLDAEELRSIVERSPFDRDHGAYARDAPPAPPEPAAPPPTRITLLGVFRADGERVALVRVEPPGEERRVRAGDAIGEFRVERVDSSSVTVVEGEATVEIGMFQE